MSAVHRALKGVNSSRGYNRFSWDEYDALPPIVRRVMQAAPVDLGTRRATQALQMHAPEAVARAEARLALHFQQELLRKKWPPGHPMVR